MKNFAEAGNLLRQSVDFVINKISATALFDRNIDAINDEPVIRRLSQQSSSKPVTVIAFGKMANHMAFEFANRFPAVSFQGVVSSPYTTDVPRVDGLTYFQGGHPLPNEASLAAAELALELVGNLNADDTVIYLVSGGGSACFELPAPNLSLADIQATFQVLVNCGAEIGQINYLRGKLSQVKSGKLSVASTAEHQLTIVVSDVPGTQCHGVSSGPTLAPQIRHDQTLQILKQFDLENRLPLTVLDQLRAADNPVVTTDESSFSDCICIGSNSDAVAVAADFFRSAGFNVKTDHRYDESTIDVAAAGMIELLDKMGDGMNCIIGGGEVISKVVGDGRGGRNQAFALRCTSLIAGRQTAVLSFGTDGVDGNSSAAGAITDGNLLQQAQSRGLEPAEFASRSDSYTFFKSLEGLIETGPTHSNLRDVRVLINW